MLSSFIHSPTQHTFIECLLCARHWGYNNEQEGKVSLSRNLFFSGGKRNDRQINKQDHFRKDKEYEQTRHVIGADGGCGGPDVDGEGSKERTLSRKTETVRASCAISEVENSRQRDYQIEEP